MEKLQKYRTGTIQDKEKLKYSGEKFKPVSLHLLFTAATTLTD